MKRSIKLVKQIGILLIGIPVIIVGIALLVLPGPGLVVIILGLVILSMEFEIARKYRDKARAEVKKAYEKIPKSNNKKIQHIAFYGTLKKGNKTRVHSKIKKSLKYIGKCKIPGELVDLGRLEGLKKGRGVVAGELYEIKDFSVLIDLDKFESIIDDKPNEPAYSRKAVMLTDPKIKAWAYFYDG